VSVVLACVILTVTYVLIATERVNRVVAALGGVAAMALLGVVETDTAFYDAEVGIDWNVIFLLFATMVIVGILKQTGLFAALAIWCAGFSWSPVPTHGAADRCHRVRVGPAGQRHNCSPRRTGNDHGLPAAGAPSRAVPHQWRARRTSAGRRRSSATRTS
jgi:hypothetical protein